jgi:hypothetical protein
MAQDTRLDDDETAASPLPVAREGDSLSLDDLAEAARYANDQADALNEELAKARQEAGTPTALMDELRRQRDGFRLQALQLSAQGIRLQAGQARVGADHISAAIAAAQARMEGIADTQTRLKKLGAVLDLLTAVVSGQGKAMVDSAKRLKDILR